MGAKTARWVNALEGIWLFSSVFFWPHTTAQSTNSSIVGIVTTLLALVALGVPAVRYLNTVAAAWLLVSAFVLPTLSLATRWNSVTVGIVIGLLSLVRRTPATGGVGPRPAAARRSGGAAPAAADPESARQGDGGRQHAVVAG